MSFADEYNKLRKKRIADMEEETTEKDGEYVPTRLTLSQQILSGDIAPVKEETKSWDYYDGSNHVAPLPKTAGFLNVLDHYGASNPVDIGTLNEIERATDKAREDSIRERNEYYNELAEAKKKAEEEANKKWFQKGAFEDGFSLKNVVKALTSTGQDLEENIMAGIVGMGEGIVDAGAYLVGGVGNIFSRDFGDSMRDFVAKDLYDEKAVAKKIVGARNPLGSITNHLLGADTDKDSLLGEKSEELAQSGGQLLGTIGLQAVGVPWFVTSGVTSFGGEVDNAFDEEATYGEAGFSGLVTAGSEILTEKLFGGSGLGEKGLINLEPLTKGISSRALKVLADWGVDMAAEGSEEIASQFMSTLGQQLSYEREEAWADLLTDRDAMDDYISQVADSLFGEEARSAYKDAFIGGAALGGFANVKNVPSSIKTGRDYRTGLTENEQKVFEKEYNNRLEEEAKQGKTLTDKQKGEIYDQVMEDLKMGAITIDTVESAIGGDTYKAYMDAENGKTALEHDKKLLQDELHELNEIKLVDRTGTQQDRINELKDKIKEINRYLADPALNQNSYKLKDQLSKEVQNMLVRDKGKYKQTDDFLIGSYVERGKRGQKYEADLTKYSEKQQEIIKKAVDSGFLNNTRKTHALVDMIAKIHEDKDVDFDFLNNERLKESSYAVNGKTVNGYYDAKLKKIGINIDSAKYLNAVVGHEVTHVLEGTDMYKELQSAIFEYAKTKGEYVSRRADLANHYAPKDIDTELTADLVGDYLFSDPDFVRNLSTKNRNVFQKLYDEIKYLCKVATAGSKEARQLEKVKHEFEKVYKEIGKASEETKHSLGYHAGDLGKSEGYHMQGGGRGTGHFGTGTYFVGDEAEINDSTYGKRPHHAVEFDNYNLYKVRNDKDGYKLHDNLHALDRGVSQEFLDAAISDRFKVSDLRQEAYRLAEQYDVKETDSDLGFEVSKDYIGASIRAMTEVAEANGVEFQNYDEWLAEQGGDVPKKGDSDYDYYKHDYCDYLRDLLESADDARNEGYPKFRDAYFDLWLKLGKDKVNRALQVVVDHQSAMEEGGYAVQQGADSNATVFMKALGYEGIDVRGTGLDNTKYGSVIYDLKGEDLARKQEIGTAKYSLSDSNGKQLTKEQSEYFKDSKVRDENGNLKVVYHGSPSDFNTFSLKYLGTNGTNEGYGFYFTDSKRIAEGYSKGREGQQNGESGKLFEVYLDIKKPLSDTEVTMSRAQFRKLLTELNNQVDADGEPLEFLSNYGDVEWEGLNKVLNYAMEIEYDGSDSDVNMVHSIINACGDKELVFDVLRKVTGYDGIIVNEATWGGDQTIYIAFHPEQIKNVDNTSPTEDADIRYSFSEESDNVATLNGGSVSKYSLSTWTPDTQAKVRDNLIKAGYESYKVDKWIKDTNSVASVIAADKDRLDFVAADNHVMLKDNQDYIKTLDASTLCAKRLVYQGTFDAIQHRLPSTMFSSDDLIDLLNMMKEHGVQTPCGVCYVESRRRHLGKFAQDWLTKYNGEYKPNLDELTTSDGLETLRKSHPQTYKDFVDAMNKKGSSNPKVVQLRTEYNNDIMSLTPSQIRKIEAIGGLRVQSFSDFETPHMLDMMQAVMDMSAKGLHSQAYTKVPNFAWVFGDTGIKINLSLIAEGDGFDADGNLAFSSTEGMDFDEAMRLRDAYSQNVGTIIVGANDKHILACMADDRIDFIIPFHRSGWGMKELEMMGMNSYTDYTYGQKEHDLNKPTKVVNGVQQYEGLENLYPIDYWDYSLTGKENAERYLNLCAKTGREPKFSQFLVNNGDGSYSLQPDGSTDGYWKTLIDFKMYDNNGVGAMQQQVQPNFNMDEAYRVLNEYEGGANTLPVANDVVEEFVAKYQSYEELAPAMSLSAEGEAPVRYGNMAISGNDVRLEGVAPVREGVAKNATTTPTVSKMEQVDDFAPITEEEANEMQTQNIASLGDEDAPVETEAPYYGGRDDVSPDNPFDNRDIKEVGNQKVKAYMYENPEVKPFFQAEANIMLGELRDTTKGERFYTSVEGGIPGEYGAESYGVWTGTKRDTTGDIAYLLGNGRGNGKGYTYAEIEKGLKDIIEDNGKENNACSKRIEFVLNDRLMRGYQTIDGFDIPANQDYINLLNEKQITEYNEEAFNRFMETADENAPIVDDIAPIGDVTPVAESATTEEISEAPIAEQYEAIKPKKVTSNEPRLKRVDSANASGKTRKWAKTSTESEAVDGKVLIDDLDQKSIHYEPISNKTTLGKANSKLNGMGYESSVAYFNSQFSNKNVSLEDIALGERLIQEAVKRGDTKTAAELIQDVSILGTELGQKVQALSIIKRLTPEGQLRMLQKTVERGKTKGDKAFEGVEITQAMIDHILKTYGKDGSYDQKKLNKAVEDVKQDIADQMKVSMGEKANAWRYLSMLGNPKTHIRNLVSNVAMRGTMAVKNAVARSIESIAPIENRTRTWKSASSEVKDFANKTTAEMKDILSDGGKYNEEASIKGKRQMFKNKILNGVYEFNSDLLTKEDWWFSKSAFTNSLSEYLTANGIRTEQDIKDNPKIVEKAKKYATEQAQIATFRQYSWLANKINEIERKNAATNIAVGAVLPFKKTPINIAKTALNYSPLGFAKTLTYDAKQVKDGNMEASELVDHLAQNITGSALTLVGYMLASAGFINGAGEEDKEGKYDYQLGEQAYSVNIGGATYSLSWLSPIAMPLFVGANSYEQLVEGKEWNGDVVLETLAKTLDPLSEMSFLSSLDSVLTSYDSGVEKFAGIAQSAGQNYITQFVPTLSSQFASVLDDTKRTTKVAGDSDFKFVDETINNLKYKIPFLRETLEPTTDIWGNEVKQTENVLTRAFETFIAPYAKRENIASEIDEEIKEVYRQTGDDGIIPSIPYNYINYDGEKYEMSAEEYTDYKKTYGQLAYDLLEELFDTATYKNATSEERAELINSVYDYARDEAKREYFGGIDIDFTNAESDGKKLYKENAIKGAIENDMFPDEYKFSVDSPEKYAFLEENGVSYEDYQNGSDEFKDAYSWAFKNPEKFTMSKAVADDLVTYRKYASELYDIKADKDSDGKSISGSRKEKVIEYVNNLDIDYGARLILFKNEYNADDTYNYDIIDYLNSREDISYEQMETILKELGFTVDANGNIYW